MNENLDSISEKQTAKGYIEDPIKRKVTLCKRKSMVLRKLIELSTMCGQDIFMCIFDKEK